MLIVKELDVLPTNFAEFIAEMAPEYRSLYEDWATADYENRVELELNASIAHASVIAFGIYMGRRVVGIAVGRVAGDIGQIAYVHILREFNDEAVVSCLIRPLVHSLRERNVTGVIMHFIPLCPLMVRDVLKNDEFRLVERMLMSYDLKRIPHQQSGTDTKPCREADWADCASLLYRAFAGKGEPILYSELHTMDRCRHTLRQYRDGGYGSVRTQWARIARRDGHLQGVALGTSSSHDTGFIFQVAVDSSSERKGIGTELVNSLLSEFRQCEIQEVQLGVTVSDDAYRFYSGLGFQDKRPVQVYLWKA